MAGSSGGRGGRALAAALFAGAAAAAAAQEGAPVKADAGQSGRRFELRRPARVTISGSRSSDEVVLIVENLDLLLVDEQIELRADHAVLWGDESLLELATLDRGAAGGDLLRFGPDVPLSPDRPPLPRRHGGDPVAAAQGGLRELYVEGHVHFRQRDERIVMAERLYHHLLERRGVVVEADAYGRSAYRDRPVDVHVRARALRSLGPRELAAEEAQFSTCPYGHPHWHVASTAMSVRTIDEAGAPSSLQIGLTGNHLELEDLPMLPLPGFTAQVETGDSLPLKKVRAGYSTKFGGFGQTLWGAEMPETARALEEQLSLPAPLALGWETAIDEYSRRGPGIGPGIDWRVPGLLQGELGGYWLRDRQDEDFSQKVPIDHADRGRGYFRDRLRPLDHWRLDTEVEYYSDSNFEREYFPRELKEEKPPESYAHLVRQEDTTRLRLLYKNRLNDFQTEVDQLPQATFDQVGAPLWQLPLPGLLEQEGRPNYLVLSHYEDVRQQRLNQARGNGLPSETVARADTLVELSTTLPLGPLSLRPFAAGELTAWDERAGSDDSIGRAAGFAGARSELVLHRDFDAWLPALGVDGLRHVVLLDADYQNAYHVSRDPSRLVALDEVDLLAAREVYLLAARQRLLTHRGESVESVLDLDLEVPLYPHADRDNVGPLAGSSAGETAGPLHFDLRHRPGFTREWLRNGVLQVEGDWSFHEQAMDAVAVALALQPSPAWTTYASWRAARGVSHVLTAEIDWQIAEKWAIAVLEQHDFDQDHGLEHRYELRRLGHDFTFALGFTRHESDGDTSVGFSLYPSFLRRGRAGRGLASGRSDRPELTPGAF